MSVAAHLAALGLRRNPFPPTPDAQCYFYTGQLDREFAEVLHCIEAGKGFVLLTGEVGLGKSTFVRRLLHTVEARGAAAALVFNTFLQGRALLSAINRDFGIAPQGEVAADMAALNAFLLNQARSGKRCLLVIDDAQNLTTESLELVRLLCNLETGQEKLLQIVLAGQPELLDMLAQNSLRQLKSRIVKHVHLEGLSLSDVGRYFDFRVTEAGGAGRLRLEPAALRHLFCATEGNPRRIHLVLDRCLYGLVAQRSNVITPALMRAAVREAGFSAGAPRRLSLRYWALAALLVPALGFCAWYAERTLGGSSRPPAAAAKATGAARPPQATARPQGLDACLQRLGAGAQADAAAIQVTQLPDALARRMDGHMDGHMDGDQSACLYRTQNAAWIAWRPRLRSAALLAAQPNEPVRLLQAKLAAAGLFDEAAVDGRLGPLTREALSRFQTRNGLPANGEPDDVTLLLLEKSQ